jgi:hypothetical protein
MSTRFVLYGAFSFIITSCRAEGRLQKLNTWFYVTNATGISAGADMTGSPDQGSEAVAASGRRGDKHPLHGPRKEKT